MRRDRGMSFSSWDDGSWVRVLKNEDEDGEEEFVDQFGQQEGEIGTLTEENIRARKEKADAEAAHREKIAEDRKASIEDPEAEAERTSTFEREGGLLDRGGSGSATDDSTEDTEKKKPKKTDAEYLADYQANQAEREQAGRSSNSRAYDEAQANRDSGNWFTRNIQRGKDRLAKPNVRYGERKNFGRVAGDKSQGDSRLGTDRFGRQRRIPRPSEALNVPGKLKQVAYDKSGEFLGDVSDAVTGTAGKVKQSASQKTKEMMDSLESNKNEKRQAQEIKTVEPLMQAAYTDQTQNVSEAFPNEMGIITQKVSELLANATQEIMSDKKPSNVNEIKTWMDMYQVAAPNSAETEEKKQTWEKILEAA